MDVSGPGEASASLSDLRRWWGCTPSLRTDAGLRRTGQEQGLSGHFPARQLQRVWYNFGAEYLLLYPRSVRAGLCVSRLLFTDRGV